MRLNFKETGEAFLILIIVALISVAANQSNAWGAGCYRTTNLSARQSTEKNLKARRVEVKLKPSQSY